MAPALPDEIQVGEETELLPTRASLLLRVRDLSSNESWREFFEIYWKLIYNTARRHGLNDAEAQDVVQDTMVGLARNLPSFRYDPSKGQFKSWLKQLIIWRIRDQVKKRLQHEEIAAAEHVPDAEQESAAFDREWEQNLMHAAIERVKLKVSPQTFQLFAFCVLQKKGVAETARVLNVSSARVYLARHRVTRAIQHEIQQLKLKEYSGYETTG